MSQMFGINKGSFWLMNILFSCNQYCENGEICFRDFSSSVLMTSQASVFVRLCWFMKKFKSLCIMNLGTMPWKIGKNWKTIEPIN